MDKKKKKKGKGGKPEGGKSEGEKVDRGKMAEGGEGSSGKEIEESALTLPRFFSKVKTKIGVHPTHGRCVVACESFAAGDIVFENVPYSAVVLDPVVDCICHHCLKPAEVLYMCGGCNFARFCSMECRDMVWAVHALECRTLSKLKDAPIEGETAPIRSVVRVFATAFLERTNAQPQPKPSVAPKGSKAPGPSVKTPKDGLTLPDCLSLVDHASDVSQQSKEILLKILRVHVEPLMEKSMWLGADVGLKIVLQMQCNAHSIVDSFKRKLGVGIYPAASYLNHSCVPNCIYSFDFQGAPGRGQVMVVRAIKRIEPGEELTYSYIDLYQTRTERQARLAAGYYIPDCDCQRCTQPLNVETKPGAPGATWLHDGYLNGFACPNRDSDINASLESVPLWSPEQKCCGETHDITQFEGAAKEAESIYQEVSTKWQATPTLETGEDCRAALEKLVAGSAKSLHPASSLHFRVYLTMLAILDSRLEVEESKESTAAACALYARKVIACLEGAGFRNHPETAAAYVVLSRALKIVEPPINKKKKKGDKASDCYLALRTAVTVREVCFGLDHRLTQEAAAALQALN